MQRREVHDWNHRDIMEWLCTELNKHNRDFENIPLDRFRTLTIEELQAMTKQGFSRIMSNRVDAEIIYNSKEELFRNSKSSSSAVPLQKTVWEWTAQEIVLWICNEHKEIGGNYEDLPLEKISDITVDRLRYTTQADFCNILKMREDEALLLYNRKEALFGNQQGEHRASKQMIIFIQVGIFVFIFYVFFLLLDICACYSVSYRNCSL